MANEAKRKPKANGKAKPAYSHEQAISDLLWARDAAQGLLDESETGGVNLTAYLRAVEQLISLTGLKGGDPDAAQAEPVVFLDDLSPDEPGAARGQTPCR